MFIAEVIPGMRAGATVRNAVLGLAYLCLLPLAVVFLPVALALVVGFNVRGTADRLSVLPGVKAGGGVVAAVAGAAFGLALLAALGAVLPGNATDAETTQQKIEGATVFQPGLGAFASVSASPQSDAAAETDAARERPDGRASD